MESERETMREGIRDKYGIKKQENPMAMFMMPPSEGSLNCAKKSPAQLAISTDDDGKTFHLKCLFNSKNNCKIFITKIKKQQNSIR
jgi:hypothetical protein